MLSNITFENLVEACVDYMDFFLLNYTSIVNEESWVDEFDDFIGELYRATDCFWHVHWEHLNEDNIKEKATDFYNRWFKRVYDEDELKLIPQHVVDDVVKGTEVTFGHFIFVINYFLTDNSDSEASNLDIDY